MRLIYSPVHSLLCPVNPLIHALHICPGCCLISVFMACIFFKLVNLRKLSLLLQNELTWISIFFLCHATTPSICFLLFSYSSSFLFAPVFACPSSFFLLFFFSSSPMIWYSPTLSSFRLPASDIQTLPRVYFFDSYATLQANGSDSRFLSSSGCHTHIPHSHLR